jgi:hypothetical protein
MKKELNNLKLNIKYLNTLGILKIMLKSDQYIV